MFFLQAEDLINPAGCVVNMGAGLFCKNNFFFHHFPQHLHRFLKYLHYKYRLQVFSCFYLDVKLHL